MEAQSDVVVYRLARHAKNLFSEQAIERMFESKNTRCLRVVVGNLVLRLCTSCGRWLPVDADHFAAQKDSGTGYGTECRECAARRQRAWQKKHPERANAQNRRRMERIRRIPGKLTAVEKRELLAVAGHRCQNCGSTDRLEFDHIIPTIDSRCTNDKSNRQVLCQECDKRKATAIIDYRSAKEVA